MNRAPAENGFTLGRLFWEWFRISLFVIGGGYAIIVVADDVFGRRRRWLAENELLDHLPVFQMTPGLIAGNSAIYSGFKLGGVAGALVSLAAVALPSFVIITAVALGYSRLPLDNEFLHGAFVGLRSALTGIMIGTSVKSWPRIMRGIYPYVAMPLAVALVSLLRVNPALVLAGAMIFGVVSAAFKKNAANAVAGCDGAGFSSAPLPRAPLAAASLALAALCAYMPRVFLLFAKYGLLCFGGGNVLLPLYMRDFVGENARFLHVTAEELGNLLAITQLTPGPISINAATFFGFRIAGTAGSFVATVALLAPSFYALIAVLRSLDRFRDNRFVRGFLAGVAPVTLSLMIVSVLIFAKMSVVDPAAGFRVNPLAALLAGCACHFTCRRKAPVMFVILACAALGALLLKP